MNFAGNSGDLLGLQKCIGGSNIFFYKTPQQLSEENSEGYRQNNIKKFKQNHIFDCRGCAATGL